MGEFTPLWLGCPRPRGTRPGWLPSPSAFRSCQTVMYKHMHLLSYSYLPNWPLPLDSYRVLLHHLCRRGIRRGFRDVLQL